MVQDLPHVMAAAGGPGPLAARLGTLLEHFESQILAGGHRQVQRWGQRAFPLLPTPGERPARPVANPGEESGKLRGCAFPSAPLLPTRIRLLPAPTALVRVCGMPPCSRVSAPAGCR